jgi:predicted small secreted protein
MKCVVVLWVVLLGTAVVGCNTIRGMGRDIERGGAKIQNLSQNTQ